MRTDKKGNKSQRWRQKMKKIPAVEFESPSLKLRDTESGMHEI